MIFILRYLFFKFDLLGAAAAAAAAAKGPIQKDAKGATPPGPTKREGMLFNSLLTCNVCRVSCTASIIAKSLRLGWGLPTADAGHWSELERDHRRSLVYQHETTYALLVLVAILKNVKKVSAIPSIAILYRDINSPGLPCVDFSLPFDGQSDARHLPLWGITRRQHTVSASAVGSRRSTLST